MIKGRDLAGRPGMTKKKEDALRYASATIKVGAKGRPGPGASRAEEDRPTRSRALKTDVFFSSLL